MKLTRLSSATLAGVLGLATAISLAACGARTGTTSTATESASELVSFRVSGMT